MVECDRLTRLESLLAILSFLGQAVLPTIYYVFTPWLSFADSRLPAWAGWLGTALFVAVWWLWTAHRDLGRNWSATVRLREGQGLVTAGAYRHIRHPIYGAYWLWCIAQALLLQNWVAGFAGLALYLPIYVYRIPRLWR